MKRIILLVDDSVTIHKIINFTFSNEEIEVVIADNGEQAISKLKDMRPDLVLADVYLPKINGYKVCQYIKSTPELNNIPVVLLVEAFEPFDQAAAMRIKADGLLKKPFELKNLVDTVNQYLSKSNE